MRSFFWPGFMSAAFIAAASKAPFRNMLNVSIGVPTASEKMSA